ncbi:MAG: 4-hydroxy-tetrahydrodipicolinate synthase [Clostridiales bacterium]|nr:4-hydroxy-tetrahydrodipicolinate synthase [Clostridiales bacterium]
MKKPVFTGAGVAIVTPMYEDGKINFSLLEELVDYQIQHKTDAIVICGTTGESPALDNEEHVEAIKCAVSATAKRVPVIAGTGSNDTAYAVSLSNEAEQAGADALLMVTPYYNKTSQHGLIEHYNFIADRVSTPIITYNVPSRTGMDIKPETYLELSKNPKIVGAKEANGSISALAKTIALCGDELYMYSGNDDQITALMSLGGKGVISVLSNILPEIAHDIAAKYLEGDCAESARLQLEYLDLCNDLFCDVNPIPVKAAMCMMGINVGRCRLPLGTLNDAAQATVLKALKNHSLV